VYITYKLSFHIVRNVASICEHLKITWQDVRMGLCWLLGQTCFCFLHSAVCFTDCATLVSELGWICKAQLAVLFLDICDIARMGHSIPRVG